MLQKISDFNDLAALPGSLRFYMRIEINTSIRHHHQILNKVQHLIFYFLAILLKRPSRGALGFLKSGRTLVQGLDVGMELELFDQAPIIVGRHLIPGFPKQYEE